MPAPASDASAAEPLIAGTARTLGPSDSAADDGHFVHNENQGHDESSLASPGLFVWLLTVCAGISGLLFGYDTGVISSTLVSINTSLSARPLTTLDKSLITSSTSLFALLFSPLTGLLADILGRRPLILLADLLFILGALLQACSTTVPVMIAGRGVVGAAVGAASAVVPLYIAETAPSQFRGRMVTVSTLFITAGQVVAYVVGWAFSGKESGWRWMVGLGAVPAVLQVVLMLGARLPESPRFLVKMGKSDEAGRVLGRVYGVSRKRAGADQGSDGDEEDIWRKKMVNDVLRRVEREIMEEEDAAGLRAVPGAEKMGMAARWARTKDQFSQMVNVTGNWRALVIACFLQGFQQLSGFNSLMYFSATIFSLVGFRSPTLTSLSIATTNFIFTLVAFHYIDRVGRRRILLLSVPIMVVGLALCAVAFHFLDLSSATHSTIVGEAVRTAQKVVSSDANGKIAPIVILMAMVIYVAGYACGIGNVPWQQSELFPLPVRSLGSALATSTNWATNTLIGLTFLPFMTLLTPSGTFLLYALLCSAGWWIVYRIYPETAGMGLEDVSTLLNGEGESGDGWGVGQSLEVWRERRRKGREERRIDGAGEG